MKALEDLTIDEVVESAEIYGVGPEETALGIQRWRSNALKYGHEQLKDNPVKFWEKSASLDKETGAALKRMQDRSAVEIISSLPDDQRKPFFDRYAEVKGDPTKMIDDQWMGKAQDLNQLQKNDTFQIDRVPPVILQAEGKDLATMALRDRGDDTWEALVLPLKEGGKPFALQIPKPTEEQLQQRIGQKQKEFDYLENEKFNATMASQIEVGGEIAPAGVSVGLENLTKAKQQELDLLKSGDLRTLALNDAQQMIKADDSKLEQIADTSLWDRVKAGAMTASVGTARALKAYGVEDLMRKVAGIPAPKDQPADPFTGFEDSLAQISNDTARGFLPTTWEKTQRASAESLGQMAVTVIPAGAATRVAGAAVSELGAASSMAPMSAGQEWSSMLAQAKDARAAGDEEGAKRMESMARWSGLFQGTIDTLTEATFGETARAFKGGKQALTNLVTAPAKEAIEEVEAGLSERGIKQPLLYPENKQQLPQEGLAVEAGAGALAGGGMVSTATVAGTGVNAIRQVAKRAALDVATEKVVDQIYDGAADWDALGGQPPVTAAPSVSTPTTTPPNAIQEQRPSDQPEGGEGVRLEDTQGQEAAGARPDITQEEAVAEPPVPPEGSAPAAPADQGASAAGEATGSTAPRVSTGQIVESKPENAIVESADLANLRKLASSSSIGENAMRTELKAYSPDERTAIARELGVEDASSAGLAKTLKFGSDWTGATDDALVKRAAAENEPSFPLGRVPEEGTLGPLRIVEKIRFLAAKKISPNSAEYEGVIAELDKNLGDPSKRAITEFDIENMVKNPALSDFLHKKLGDDVLPILAEANRLDVLRRNKGRLNTLEDLGEQFSSKKLKPEQPVSELSREDLFQEAEDRDIRKKGLSDSDVATSVQKARNVEKASWEKAIEEIKPDSISAAVVDAYNLKLPKDYTRHGDRFVRGLEESPPSYAGIPLPKFEQLGDTRYSVSAPAAQPISQERAARVVAQTFNGRTPANVTFINDPSARTPQGQMWAGQANRSTGQITINLAAVQDEADLAERVKEEALHLVWQDPRVQDAVTAVQSAVTPEMIAEVEKMGYSLGEQPEEAAVRLVQQLVATPDGRSLMRRVIDAIKNAFRRLFRMEPSAQQVQAAARKVMSEALAGRATAGEGVRYSEAVDAEYAAAVAAGDMEKAQRIIDDVAKRAGFSTEGFKAMPESDWRSGELIRSVNSTNGPWAGFFTSDKSVADRFGRIMRQPVIRTWIKIVNPFVVNAEGKAAGELQFDIIDDSGPFKQKNNPEVLAAIRSGKYDGVILENTTDEATVIVPLTPQQVKSAEAITRDDQGNVIPPSKRFDLSSSDIRYSLAQVFGQETEQPTKGDSYKAAETLAKAVYFDGDQPVTPAATDEAWTKALNWGPAVVGQLLEAGKGMTNKGEDSVAIIGKAQVQLYKYAHQLVKAGDPSLHNYIMINAPKWTQVVDKVLTSGDVGALLGSRVSGLESSQVMLAANKTGESREAAETKHLPKKFVDEVDAAIVSTKLEEGQVRRVKRGAKRKTDGKTLEDTVEELEAAPAAEENRNARTAESILDQLAKLQSDTPSLTGPGQINAVRELIRKALAPTVQFEKTQLIAALQALEVDPPLADRLADAVWTQRRHNAEVTIARTQRALAEGSRGSLKPMEDALISAPAPQQQSPVWRHNTALRYFQQLGLNPQQAAAAARLYNNEFAARLQDALEGAIGKVAATRAPWARGVPATVRKRMETDLAKIRRATRLGVTNPNIEWHTDLAKSNGWHGFTPEQFQRLSQIDEHLADENLPLHKAAELKVEVGDMTRRAGLPPKVMDYIAASFAISGLTGLPTFFVQFAGPVNIMYRWFNDLVVNPVVATKAMIASMDTFVAEAKKAARTGVFTEQVNETLHDAVDPLKDLFERGIANYERGGTAAAIGIMQIIIGAQQFAGRSMNTIDQAAYAAAKLYAQALFTARELKSAGWTREDAAMAVLETITGRQNTRDLLVMEGLPREEATITADEEMTRALNELAPGMEIPASNEALGAIGRLGHLPFDVQEGKTTRQTGTAIQELDDGLIRKAGGMLIVGLNALLKQGGSSIVIGRSTVGYFAIPFRAAVWTSNYMFYGYARYLINHWKTQGGAYPERSPYKQSFATRQQMNQRLIDASMGTVLMVAAVAFRGSSGKDDPDKWEPLKFIFTGKGPNDPIQRQAWLKRFAPYSMTIKIGTSYTPFNTTRMFESLGWQLAVAGALDDRELNRAHGALNFGEKVELIGAYIGSLTMRSSFQGISQDLGRNSAEITKTITQKVGFSATGIIPWKGAMMSINRLLDDPPDRKTLQGMIQANTPWLYLAGRPALNVFGDVLRDDTLAGKAYREGIPLVPRFPTSDNSRIVYDLVLKHGKGPSIVDAGDVGRYGAVTPEQLYNYGKIRGQMMKAEIIANASKWNSMDRKQYDNALERMARRFNPIAAEAAGLKPVPK